MAPIRKLMETLLMFAPCRIEGYVIVSSDGMIADAQAVMPDSLKIEADHRFLEGELDRFAAVVHGRHSHEGQPNSALRRRLVVTHRIAAIAPNPDLPKSLLWNPAGASFEEACAALDLDGCAIAILGGTRIYDMFLDVGYDAFNICRAGKVKIGAGTPVFSRVCDICAPEEVLSENGLTPEPRQILDEANQLSLVRWTRNKAA
jgi:hypothetical protein